MNSPAIIVPQKIETEATRRGRAVLKHIIDSVLELADRGKHPNRIIISTALRDDLCAFFDYAYTWDGVLPRDLCGCPIEYEPGASRAVIVKCEGDD